ncbi:MAG: universal stress protein [Steroidobacteraceae bacterium]
MKQSIHRILIAVKDVDGGSSPAVKKAARLARALGAEVELFHAISEPLAVDAVGFGKDGLAGFENKQRARHLKRLEAMAAPLRRTGIAVSVAAEWDYPVHEAVLRRAHRTKADLVVAGRHDGTHAAPWMLRHADWELLRHCPVPVLLVKTRRAYESLKVLAAIDPSHAFAKTAGLDERILRIGAEISKATRGKLHAVHAFVPSLSDIPAAMLTQPNASSRIVTGAATAADARFKKTLRTAQLGSLPPGRRHLVEAPPTNAIPQVARQNHVDIVVMGLVRSGLKGFFIGNTAEQILDELACDLLIVKPRGFKSRVPARVRGPQLVSLGPAFGVV